MIEELETTTEKVEKEEIKTTQGNTLIECKNDSRISFQKHLKFLIPRKRKISKQHRKLLKIKTSELR